MSGKWCAFARFHLHGYAGQGTADLLLLLLLLADMTCADLLLLLLYLLYFTFFL